MFYRGKWKGVKSCTKGMAICGIRVRVDKYRGHGLLTGYDDTALNGAEFKCCSLPQVQDTRVQSCSVYPYTTRQSSSTKSSYGKHNISKNKLSTEQISQHLVIFLHK